MVQSLKSPSMRPKTRKRRHQTNSPRQTLRLPRVIHLSQVSPLRRQFLRRHNCMPPLAHYSNHGVRATLSSLSVHPRLVLL